MKEQHQEGYVPLSGDLIPVFGKKSCYRQDERAILRGNLIHYASHFTDN